MKLAARDVFAIKSQNKPIVSPMSARSYLRIGIASVSTAVACLTAYGEGGLVLEKPYYWSPNTEVVSVREFSRQLVIGPIYGRFMGTDGKEFRVQSNIIAGVIFYPEVGGYTDIQDEAQLSPLLSDLDQLKKIVARYPPARRHLDPQIAKLENEVSLFRGGARKIAGVWHSAAEIAARKAEEERIEAARKAEEERVEALRAAEQKAAEERKAAAEAAVAKQADEFKKEGSALLANTHLPPSDFRELRTLDDVKELTPADRQRISALAEKVRSIREQDGNQRLVELCHAEVAGTLALNTRANIPGQIHANDAAAALTSVNSFLQDNPSPPSDGQTNLWQSLTSIRTLCSRLESEARPHREKAQSLSSAGKSGDAIREDEIAYRIFPDPEVAAEIKQLREKSLGL